MLDAQNRIKSKKTMMAKYASQQILNSDHYSFQKNTYHLELFY